MGRRPELFNSGYYEYSKNINSVYYEWLSGAREYVSSGESALLREWCMRVVHESDAESALLREWCMRVAHESGAREWCTRVVHENGAREWCTRLREWCTKMVHESGAESGAREFVSGARD